MRKKQYTIQIWFLSDNLQESAEWLSNKYLNKSIVNCMNIILAVRFYFIGIRSAKFYKYYFSAEKKDQTFDSFFPNWPLRQKPSFSCYKSKVSKWCRKCNEHYEYVVNYLNILLSEYFYRYSKHHNIEKFMNWLISDAPRLNIPNGNLKKIILPWKCLNPLYRNIDICKGYRDQYKALLKNYGIKVSDFKNRDIPEFLIDMPGKFME